MDEAIAVFTYRDSDQIIREGGSQAWKLNESRAKNCRWLVCTQNCNSPFFRHTDQSRPHRSAFLVGRISKISKATEDDGDRRDDESQRFIIEIDEYALVDRADVWKGWRNPVRYTSLSELGIDLAKTDLRPLEAKQSEIASGQKEGSASAGLTIQEAKSALSKMYGVSPDQIEITIRG